MKSTVGGRMNGKVKRGEFKGDVSVYFHDKKNSNQIKSN